MGWRGSARLGCVAALLLFPTAALALCAPKRVEAAKISEPFTYLESVIDSLGWAKQGLSRGTEAGGDFYAVVYRLKLAQRDYDCAAEVVRPFSESPDQVIKASAGMLNTVYGVLGLTNQTVVRELLALLDQFERGQLPSESALVDRATDLGVMIDEVWKTLPMAVISATYVLPKFDRQKPTGRFRIAEAQRRLLLRQLEGRFGTDVRKGMRVGQHALDGAAGALHQFLADRKWRSLDDP